MRKLFLLLLAAALASLDAVERWRVIRIAGEIAPENQSVAGSRLRMAGVCTCF
jgi:hypothetical protein